jgi:predicted DNA-binding transcriptional regulator AlpA
MTPDEPRYLDARGVMRRLGISLTTVYAWTKAGKLPPPRKFGDLSRWPIAEIELWEEQQTRLHEGGKP